VAYSIVDGRPLDVPADASLHIVDGVDLRVTRSGALNVVTWTRDRHSCVLSAATVSVSTLERLAGWRAGGSISY
jgi:hypothetical protein